MFQVSCVFCEHIIRANDIDQEIICGNCGRRFSIESGDACYVKNKEINSSFSSIKKN